MNVRHWMKRRTGGIVLGLCAMLAAGGCGHTETIVHGREFLDDGSLKVASLQPACGCVSLKNTSNRRLMLESTFVGITRGTVFLDPNEQTRVLFDWGGEANEDFYLVDAFDVNAEGQPVRPNGTIPKLKMHDVVSEYAPFVTSSCGDDACTFNGLAMNRMMADVEELERENPNRGIEFTSVITVSAPANECGCMMLTNFSQHDLTLRSTLHGTETGQMDLKSGVTVPLSFDWAGPLDNDAYVIDAVDVRTPGDAPRATVTTNAQGTPDSQGGRAGSAMTIRLKDHVKIDGTLVNMTCNAEYAEFISHRNTAFAEASVRCPWKPEGVAGLGMRVAFDKRSQLKTDEAAATKPVAAAPKPQ